MDLDYVLYTDSDIDNINLEQIKYQDMRDFIDKIDATKVQDKGRLFAKFKNGNFATIAMEQKTEITIPTRTVTYALGDGNNINWWSKLFPNTFTSIDYNSTNKMNTITMTTTANGWEQLYMPMQTIAGQSYTIQFDYKLDTELTGLNAEHTSLAYQILAENTNETAIGTELSNSNHKSEDIHISTGTLPTNNGASGTITLNFTAKANTSLSYLVFNFGFLADNKTYKVELGNMRVVENVTGRTVYGPMLSPKFGQPDGTHAPSPQPIVPAHNFRGWFDETHLDQSGNQIEVKETTSISPSLFTDNKETVTAHFD